MKDTTKKIVNISIAFILLIVFGYFAVKDVDFTLMWKSIINADYLWVILSAPVILMSHWVRALRWKTMLAPVIKDRKISTWNLFSSVMIGYAANNVIPRSGEFLRPYVSSKREKISFSMLFATIIVERFIDVITLLLLFGGVFFFFRDQIVQSLPNLDANKIIIPTLLIVFVLILSFYPPFFRLFLRVIIKPLSKNLYEKLNKIFDSFIQGFRIIKTPSAYFRVILESLTIWLFYTIPLFLMFYAFPFRAQFHLSFDDAILLIVVSGIGTTIAPTPGAIGVYHYLISNTLVKIYGLTQEDALAYAIVTWAINFLMQMIPGGLFFLRENIKRIPKEAEISIE